MPTKKPSAAKTKPRNINPNPAPAGLQPEDLMPSEAAAVADLQNLLDLYGEEGVSELLGFAIRMSRQEELHDEPRDLTIHDGMCVVRSIVGAIGYDDRDQVRVASAYLQDLVEEG